jgi:hypothetical protein
LVHLLYPFAARSPCSTFGDDTCATAGRSR